MTEETKTKEETLAEMKRKIKELEDQLTSKSEEVDELKKKEEGWLVWTDNPTYNGQTLDIQFTDGMAFIPFNRVYPRFIPEKLTELQIDSIAESQKITSEKLKERIDIRDNIPTSQRAVAFLVGDFGYHAQYYTKDQMDELQKRMSDRARERAEVQAKMGTQSDMLEKLLTAHKM